MVLFLFLLGGIASAERMAVLVQCALGIPPADIQRLRLYTAQLVATYGGFEVVPDREVRRAEARLGVYLGTYIPEEGVRKILREVGADYLLLVRVIGWEDKWEIRAERALLISGVGLLDPTLGDLLGPLGLLSALDRKAKVTLLVRLYNQKGLIHANVVSADDAPFPFSWLFANPMRAARKAMDMALKQLLQML